MTTMVKRAQEKREKAILGGVLLFFFLLSITHALGLASMA
jgi:hypothetical protein